MLLAASCKLPAAPCYRSNSQDDFGGRHPSIAGGGRHPSIEGGVDGGELLLDLVSDSGEKHPSIAIGPNRGEYVLGSLSESCNL